MVSIDGASHAFFESPAKAFVPGTVHGKINIL
jgi:hypothetical protein